MRRALLVLGALVVALALVPAAQASVSQSVTIVTSKPLGPYPGTFKATGGIDDKGSFTTLKRVVGAIPSPNLLISELTLLFEGKEGTFTIKAQLQETPTSDPAVFANEGTWVIVDGTGAYAGLHGGGKVVGTVNDAKNLITRTFTGEVHFN